MKTALRLAVVVLMAAAANVRAADVPLSDGDIAPPTETAEEKAKAAEEAGGGAGEPERREEAAPVSRAETETEAELWMDRGGD